VLLVGFAYVWKRGDLDWVRTLSRERAAQLARPPRTEEREPALTP
jgi:NADH-quinone oxidoreductase subunit A